MNTLIASILAMLLGSGAYADASDQCSQLFALDPVDQQFVHLVLKFIPDFELLDLEALINSPTPLNPLASLIPAPSRMNTSNMIDRLLPRIKNWTQVRSIVRQATVELNKSNQAQDQIKKATRAVPMQRVVNEIQYSRIEIEPKFVGLTSTPDKMLMLQHSLRDGLIARNALNNDLEPFKLEKPGREYQVFSHPDGTDRLLYFYTEGIRATVIVYNLATKSIEHEVPMPVDLDNVKFDQVKWAGDSVRIVLTESHGRDDTPFYMVYGFDKKWHHRTLSKLDQVLITNDGEWVFRHDPEKAISFHRFDSNEFLEVQLPIDSSYGDLKVSAQEWNDQIYLFGTIATKGITATKEMFLFRAEYKDKEMILHPILPPINSNRSMTLNSVTFVPGGSHGYLLVESPTKSDELVRALYKVSPGLTLVSEVNFGYGRTTDYGPYSVNREQTFLLVQVDSNKPSLFIFTLEGQIEVAKFDMEEFKGTSWEATEWHAPIQWQNRLYRAIISNNNKRIRIVQLTSSGTKQ